MDSLSGDLRLAFRSLSKSPGFSAIAVIAFALGIGANAAIFSVVNALLLRPMSYASPERLVVIEHRGPSPVAPATYLDWRRQSTAFTDMAAAQVWGGALRSAGEAPESLNGLRVTANLFSLLGVPPLRGRTFVADEDQDGSAPVVVISHALWQRSFGGENNIIGRHVVIDDTTFTVVGVMPPSFQFAPFWATKAEIWSPFYLGDRRADRVGKSIRVFARLKPGKSIDSAQAEMSTIMSRLAQQYPDSSAKETAHIVSLNERVVGNMRPMLLVLLGTVAFVLLIACANVANLMLARASGRRREVAVRLALGATKWRLARRSLAESAILALLGGAGGLFLAWALIRVVQVVVPAFTLPRQGEIALDASVVLFTASLSLVTGLVASILPAWHAAKGDVNDALKEGGRTGSGGTATHFTRTVLVVVETALAFVLLVGAGLMVRSFAHLLVLNPGFDAKNLISAEISVAGTRQADPARRLSFYRETLERIAAIPGVRSASIVNHAPITGDVWGTQFRIEGRPEPLPGEVPGAVYRVAFPGYFEAMRAPLIRGKDFDDRDTLDAPFVVVVNQALASKHWPNEEAVGKRIVAGTGGRLRTHTIVGVVQDIKQSDWQASPREEIYFPFLQSVEYLSSEARHNQSVHLVIRVDVDPAGKIASVRQAIAAVDANVVVRQATTMESAVAQNTWRPRLSLFLLGAFGLVAIVLAITGIYGVISHAVSQRTQEIGIRIALGAASRSVLMQSIVRSLGPLCAGLAIGALLASSLTRLMQTMLFGVQPTDAITFGTAAALMFGAGLFASFWPALRAARVDPVIALRHD